ncbi:carbohydrate ABC transporter permease [Paenibacillus roseipurpureus]|uniref:Carbohydrate ABC transporter permease n=1 Tax=Paenibacillus roseopurpureus TaxID=2918901 RepID=A0AA96LQU0_9BACL|nr:carbohydrate ABC transporter permease [Paenibacillus sp. MBLB1832]WNR45552.1 carbohydrate ABC transporter permease [Paenibacillus sp. MBLB1832]
MRASLWEKLFYRLNEFILLLAALTCLLPLIHITAVSFSHPMEVTSGHVTLWPIEPTWNSFEALLIGTNAIKAMLNSVVITVVGVIISMIATVFVAYPLAKTYFLGRKFFSVAIVFTMLFGGGLIPQYIVVKSLGIINTYWALWLPGMISTYNMWVMKSFFQELPRELEDAARIDGCNELRLLARIILPMSMPMLVSIALFYGVGYWNNFFQVLIYINETGKYNLAVLIQQLIISLADPKLVLEQGRLQDIAPEGIKAAGVLIMIAPMLAVYPFLQKHFVKGVMIGSLKG